jgi:hypothetical protein
MVFIHSTIHSWNGALPCTIFPLCELILLHAYKYILLCIWSFYSTVIPICKSCDFFYLNLCKECLTNSSKSLGGGGKGEVSEWVAVALKLCRKWNTFFVCIFINTVACEHGSSILLLSWSHSLTFSVRHLNSVFMLRVRNFLHDGPLNRCACLTINVHKLYTEGDEIIKYSALCCE